MGADAVDVFSRAAAIAAICDHDVDAVEIIEGVRSWLQADPDVDPVRMGVLEAKYARFLLDSGRTDAALVSARRAVALVPADPPTPERGVVVSGLVHVMDWAGGGSDWEPLADEAVEVARAIGDKAALARALIIRTTVRPGSPEVVQDAREAVDLAIAGHGDPELVAQTYSNLVDCLSCAGLAREGIDVAAVGMAAASSRGLGIRYGSWLATQAAEIAPCTAGGTRPRASSTPPSCTPATCRGPTATTPWSCGPGCRRCAATGTGWTPTSPSRPAAGGARAAAVRGARRGAALARCSRRGPGHGGGARRLGHAPAARAVGAAGLARLRGRWPTSATAAAGPGPARPAGPAGTRPRPCIDELVEARLRAGRGARGRGRRS